MMKDIDPVLLLGFLRGTVLGLADFNNREFTLNSGPVTRVFEEELYHNAILEFRDGSTQEVDDSDLETLDAVVRTYMEENPERYRAYIMHNIDQMKQN